MAPSVEQRTRLLRDFFVGRRDTFTEQQLPDAPKPYLAIKKELTDPELMAHCRGEKTISTYLVDDQGTTPVAVLDIDSKEEPAQQIIIFAKAWLKGYGLQGFVEPSGRKGYHIWIIFKNRLPAAKAKRMLEALMSDWLATWCRWAQAEKKPFPFIVKDKGMGPLLIDFEDKEVHLPFLIEINPKQEQKTSLEAPGSGVKLPWGKHRITGKWTAFLDEQGQIPQDWGMSMILQSPAVTELVLDEILKKHPEIPRPSAPVKGKETGKERSYGLPCFAKLMDGVTEGFRHIASFRLAIQLYRQKVSQERALSMLMNWNDANNPALSRAEIEQSVKSAYTGKYKLGCADIEGAGLCDKSCPVRSKRYLERDDKVESKADEVIERLVKVTTEPPAYIVTVMGGIQINMSVDELFNLTLFQKKCMADANLIPHIELTNKQWHMVINQKISLREDQPAPIDARESVGIVDNVYDWLRQTPKAQNGADISAGRPVVKDEDYLFRAKDVLTYLKKQHKMNMFPHELWGTLRKWGASSTVIRMGGDVFRLWRLPMKAMSTQADKEVQEELRQVQPLPVTPLQALVTGNNEADGEKPELEF
jgi:hypothetical protein